MSTSIPINTKTHLEKLVESAIRSLNAVKTEPTVALKQVELNALQEKVIKIEQHLEELAKGRYVAGKGK